VDFFTPDLPKNQLPGILPMQRVSAHVIMVTPEIARRMRDEWHFPNQRVISVLNVERLSSEMTAGWFVVGTPLFVCVLPDGTRYLVNGNHTCEAVSDSGVSLPLTVIELQVADFDDAARVYATFDIHKARTWIDTLKATGAYEDFSDAGKVASAVGIIMNNFRFGTQATAPTANSRTARTMKMAEYKDAASVIAGCMSGGPQIHTRLMKRAAVLAVALETARYQPTAAIDFWHGFVMDDGLSAKDPRKALSRWLQTNSSSGGSKVARLHAFVAARAWNLHYDGKTVDFIKPTAMTNFVLKGTPWK
jgi:hypothetical protein